VKGKKKDESKYVYNHNESFYRPPGAGSKDWWREENVHQITDSWFCANDEEKKTHCGDTPPIDKKRM